jgi:DNA mismatch endonuclease, patch repair protein
MTTAVPIGRSLLMAKIGPRDTRPEIAVRRLVHSLGFRYRVCVKGLPGTPDMVFKRRRKVIFIHGCFWHRHSCRQGRSTPSTRRDFWCAKFDANRRRDARNRRMLKSQGGKYWWSGSAS